MTTLVAATAAAVAGTMLFGWAAVPLAGAGLGWAEARRSPSQGGAPSALRMAGRGAVAGAFGWALLLLWGGLGAPVTDVAVVMGRVAGGLPAALVVVVALVVPALLAGTAAGAAFAGTSVVLAEANLRRRGDG